MGTQVKLRAVQKEGEKPDLDRHWRALFLDTLAETSNVSAAARVAGASTSRAYKTRKLDPEFRRLWNEALMEGYANLEMETLERLRFGVEAGKDERKFDIANALRLLAMHRDTVAHQRALESEEDEESVLESLNEKLELMRLREAEVKQMLLEDGSQDRACDASG